jgi:hypothetical protein
MHSALTTLIDRLDSPALSGTEVIGWGAPVPSFGDLSRARVATLGLNPSNREFVDEEGDELRGPQRRFHTLNSLGIRSWTEVDAGHLELILDSCRTYFLGNPYDKWFKKLDQIVSGSGASYYDGSAIACHLDLIPYATARKWTDLAPRQRSLLFDIAADSLALLLKDSPVRLLILNGQSVVDQFEHAEGIRLERREMGQWALQRRGGGNIAGFAYRGQLSSLCGIEVSQPILVLGYNHNIQSSFGITTSVVAAIREWVAEAAEGPCR